MSNLIIKRAILVITLGFISASVALAQAGQANTLYNRLNIGPGGPAPKHDLSGAWTGPLDAQLGEVPPMTPLGQQKYKENKPERQYHVAGSNDPFNTCDPFGFPRSDLNEVRGMAFGTMPDRILILNQYQQIWRMIWMDGRSLPKNVGGTGKDVKDPRYYGYSVGHWENDNTLVVETTGLDDRTWINSSGYPHSVNAVVTERFTRIDHNDLQLVITLDDPAYYTKAWVLATDKFKWIPNQELEQQLCIPSEMIEYRKIIASPATSGEPGN